MKDGIIASYCFRWRKVLRNESTFANNVKGLSGNKIEKLCMQIGIQQRDQGTKYLRKVTSIDGG